MGIFDSVFGKKEKKEKKALPWITLESVAQLEEIVKKSKNKSYYLIALPT